MKEFKVGEYWRSRNKEKWKIIHLAPLVALNEPRNIADTFDSDGGAAEEWMDLIEPWTAPENKPLSELIGDSYSCFAEYWRTPMDMKTWEAKSEELKHLHTWLSATHWKTALLQNELNRYKLEVDYLRMNLNVPSDRVRDVLDQANRIRRGER